MSVRRSGRMGRRCTVLVGNLLTTNCFSTWHRTFQRVRHNHHVVDRVARAGGVVMRTRLVPLDNSPPIELAKDLTLVGRVEDCDVRFDHKSVSKLHCILAKTDGLLFVRDLGSTNGTRVNGTRVRRAALLPNDMLAIASFRYQVRIGDSDDDSTPKASTPVEPMPPAEDDDAREPEKPRLAEPVLKRNALPDVYPDAPPKE